MARLIDADALMKALVRKEPFNDNARLAIAECMEEVRHSPTVSQWIPCGERMPEKDGYYLATCERFGWNAEKEKEIFTDVVELFRGDWLEPGKIVAWMPLPKPYKRW